MTAPIPGSQGQHVVNVRCGTVRLRDGSATYREAGQGSVAIITAGLGLSSRFYEKSFSEFAAAGVRLVVPDLPGLGGTPGPATGLGPAETASFLLDFADAAGIASAVWIGHSLGAQAVMELAARRPDRANGIVLVGPTGAPGRFTLARQVGALAIETKRTSLSVIRAVAREYIRISPVRYFGSWIRHAHHDVPGALRRVACPVLVLTGDRDPVSRQDYIRLIETLAPDVRTENVAGGTHALPRGHPAAFNRAVISFIRALSAPGIGQPPPE